MTGPKSFFGQRSRNRCTHIHVRTPWFAAQRWRWQAFAAYNMNDVQRLCARTDKSTTRVPGPEMLMLPTKDPSSSTVCAL